MYPNSTHPHPMGPPGIRLSVPLRPRIALQFSDLPIEFARSARVLRAPDLMTAVTNAVDHWREKLTPAIRQGHIYNGFLLDQPLGGDAGPGNSPW